MADYMKKYRARIVKEGIVKSLVLGLSIGAAALTVCLLLSWFFGFKQGLWIGIALFAACVGGITPAFYFLKFRPTVKAVARRVDELGLEERILTMTELEGDDSFMAACQREDARRALKAADHMLIKVMVSASLIVTVGITSVFGIGMTTVDALYYADIIPSGVELLASRVPIPEYSVRYTVEAATAGKIVLWDETWGEPVLLEDDTRYDGQKGYTVQEGQSAPAVYAMDFGGYTFSGWSDGVMSRYREDANVVKNIDVVAYYDKISDEEVPPDDPIVQDRIPSENSPGSNEPSDPGDSSSQNGDPDQGDENGGGNQGGGSHNDASQQIVDGQTYYGDNYDNAHQDAMDRLGSDSNLGDDLKGWISDYYDSIHRGSGEGGEAPGEGTPGEGGN